MYLDRYLKFNYFIYVLNKIQSYDIEKIRHEAIKNKRKYFCAAVISNQESSSYFRLNFIKELNNYKKFHMGGRAFNNIGRIVDDKIKFYLLINFHCQWRILKVMAMLAKK